MKKLTKELNSTKEIAEAYLSNTYENTDSVKLLVQATGREYMNEFGKEALMTAIEPFTSKQALLLTDVNELESFLNALKIERISFLVTKCILNFLHNKQRRQNNV